MNCTTFHKDEYALAGHILTAVELPMVIFVLYCIAVHSPPALKNFKWLLFGQQFGILVFKIASSDFAVPIFYFPALGLVFNGPSNKYLTSPQQMTILAFMAAQFAVLTIALFEYRHQLIVPRTSPLAFPPKVRKGLYVGRLCAGIAIAAMFSVFASDQNVAIAEWVTKFSPCILAGIDDDSSTLLYTSTDAAIMMKLVSLVVLPFALEILLYIGDSFRLLTLNQNLNISERTRKLQRAFLRALIFQGPGQEFQEMGPLVIIYPAPIGFFVYSLAFDYTNIDVNNVNTLLLLSHGVFASTAIVVANRPYRNFALSVITRLHPMHVGSKRNVLRLTRERIPSRSWVV